jgi:hypothetical protein
MSPSFASECSSAFTRLPFRDFHPRLISAVRGCESWPTVEQYDELAASVPRAGDVSLPRFVAENRATLREIGGYEQHVAQLRAVPTRQGHWHDFFNMLVWTHFPKLRWALNALHVDPRPGPIDPRNGRAPAQNVAATFDEAGMIVLSTSRALLDELRALQFRRAFWERREELLSTTRFWVVGHGMLESLLTPHSGLAARSLLLQVPSLPRAGDDDAFRFDVDRLVAERIGSWRAARTVLDPIPVLAIPGFSANDAREFYEDMRNIRFEPISRRPADLAVD